MNLKSSNPALRGGDPAVTTYWLKTSADDKVFTYVRKNGKDEVLTVLNMSKNPVQFTINDDILKGTFKDLFTGAKRDFGQDKAFSLPVSGFAVFEK
ncbi:alpha-glucosidase C-terminal domain-containing protein [Chryseobacterium taklimakanense]|uniref:alpha-glucosidase C-terminal domain-containing protein n=1 Tax=Chryseobacterium taklimakanense TaxID=536441 RepID=UPI001E2C5BD4|nr:alpha-glucosidase C-terminal domain-containing protein [Chryseobacterium taklimakanense]